MESNQALVTTRRANVTRTKAAIKKRAIAITQSIDEVKRDAQRIKQVSRQEIEDVAEKYSRAPSTFLAGVVGGVLGAGGGVTIGTFGGAALIITGPLGLAIGAALGVLAFRGRNYRRLERATQKTRGAIDLIKAEISALPSDAPSNVRDALYNQYQSLLTEYSRIAHESIDDGPKSSNYAGLDTP